MLLVSPAARFRRRSRWTGNRCVARSRVPVVLECIRWPRSLTPLAGTDVMGSWWPSGRSSRRPARSPGCAPHARPDRPHRCRGSPRTHCTPPVTTPDTWSNEVGVTCSPSRRTACLTPLPRHEIPTCTTEDSDHDRTERPVHPTGPLHPGRGLRAQPLAHREPAALVRDVTYAEGHSHVRNRQRTRVMATSRNLAISALPHNSRS